MMLAPATILLSALTVAPADVTGKWEGQLTATRSDGSTHQDTVLLILTQKGGTKSVGARPISMRSGARSDEGLFTRARRADDWTAGAT
jgi:hypothetical protein